MNYFHIDKHKINYYPYPHYIDLECLNFDFATNI